MSGRSFPGTPAHSLNRRQLHQDFIGQPPKLFLLFLNIRKVCFVSSAAFVEPLCDLIDVIVRVAQELEHFFQLRQVQLYHKTVQRHLAEKRFLVRHADALHFFFQQPVFFKMYPRKWTRQN